MKFVFLLLFSLTVNAADKPLPKIEQAVRAGTNVVAVIPAAAKPGEAPRDYASPGKAVGNPHPGPPPYGKGPKKP